MVWTVIMLNVSTELCIFDNACTVDDQKYRDARYWNNMLLVRLFRGAMGPKLV